MNVTRVAPLQSPYQNFYSTISSLGNNTIIAATPGLRYRILQAIIVPTAATTVTFFSGSTQISAAFPLAANGMLVLPFDEHGWFNTSALGDSVVISLGTATSTGVQLLVAPITQPVTGLGS